MVDEDMCKFFNTKKEAKNYAKTLESYNNYIIKGDYINNVEQQKEVFNEILKLKNKI